MEWLVATSGHGGGQVETSFLHVDLQPPLDFFQWTTPPPFYDHCNTSATSLDAIHHPQHIGATSASLPPTPRLVPGHSNGSVDNYEVSNILVIGVVGHA